MKSHRCTPWPGSSWCRWNRGRGIVTHKPNPVKSTADDAVARLKDMILAALDEAGGQVYLARQAVANPVAFMALLGRVLPLTLAGDPNNPVRTISRIELVHPG